MIKGNQTEIEPYACLVPLSHISVGKLQWINNGKADLTGEAFIGRYQ